MYTHHAVLTCDAQVHAYETHMPCTHTLPCSRAYRAPTVDPLSNLTRDSHVYIVYNLCVYTQALALDMLPFLPDGDRGPAGGITRGDVYSHRGICAIVRVWVTAAVAVFLCERAATQHWESEP